METRYTEKTGIILRHSVTYNVTLRRKVSVWGHFDTNSMLPHGMPAHVGPWYKTKAEALADHYSYLVRGGWLRPDE